MEKEEKSLFGNLSLMDDGLIDVSSQPEPVVKEGTTEEHKETPVDKKQDVNDGTIEIDDVVQNIIGDESNTEDNEVKDTPPDNNGNSSSSINLVPFAKALYEEGVFNEFDETEFNKYAEEYGHAEALIEFNRRTIESEIEAYKKEADEDYKAFLEARNSGVDINEWGNIHFTKKQYEAITDETLESNEDLQKNLIRADLKRRNFEDDEITSTLESYEDTNKLSKMAQQALKNLRKHEEAKEAELIEATKRRDKEMLDRQKQQLATLKQTITESNEIVPGIKINKQTKEKIYNMIITPTAKGPNGEPLNAVMAKRMEDPIKYSILEAYFVELGLFDKKFDTLTKKSKSQAVKELETTLSKANNTSFIGGKSVADKLFTDEGVDKDYEAAWSRI